MKLRYKKAKPKDEYVYIPHIDSDWINKKIDGHGGAFTYNNKYSCAKIDYIGSTSSLRIFYYNIILWLKYVKRNINKMRNGEFYG